MSLISTIVFFVFLKEKFDVTGALGYIVFTVFLLLGDLIILSYYLLK